MIRIPKDLVTGTYQGGYVRYNAPLVGNVPATTTSIIRYPNEKLGDPPTFTAGVSTPIALSTVPTTVWVNGVLYRKSINPTLSEPNTFFYNPQTRIFTLSEPVTTTNVVVYVSRQRNEHYRLQRQFARDFRLLPSQFEVTWTRTWQEQPSASFQFKIPYYLKKQAEEQIRPGTDFQIADVALQITGLSITEVPASQSTIRECLVSVSCSGKWSGARLRPQTAIAPGAEGLQQSNTSGGFNNDIILSNGRPNIPARVTLQDMANRAGTPLLFPETSITIPENGRSEPYDWAADITPLAAKVAAFPFWSSNAGVSLVPYENVANHVIYECDIRSAIQTEVTPAARDIKSANTFDFNWLTTTNPPAVVTQPVTPPVEPPPPPPPANSAPVAANDSGNTAFQTPFNGSVLTNDTDADNDTITVISNTNPTNGTVTVNPNGTYQYTPNNNFDGNDSFTYTISDGDDTATGTVTITVAPPVYLDLSSLSSDTNVGDGQTNAGSSTGAQAIVTGSEVSLRRNIWIVYDLPQSITVTATNAFNWDFRLVTEAEIHAIGLLPTTANDQLASQLASRSIYHAGTQTTFVNFSYIALRPYSGSTYQTFNITLSSIYPVGTVLDRLFIINDDDDAPHNSQTDYRNVYFTD